jgi:hypothetical protein
MSGVAFSHRIATTISGGAVHEDVSRQSPAPRDATRPMSYDGKDQF